MHFPLLEALLQKNPGLCRQRIKEFYQTETDNLPIFKSIYTYAAQHSLSDDSGPDAVVFSDSLINVLAQNHRSLTPDQRMVLLGKGIDYLCSIVVDIIDTTVLKPSVEETKVVSIHDLEDAFKQNDLKVVVNSVRDLLSLMDNKHYFMEILYLLALNKSSKSLLLASATSRAIEIMGWKNNFTPFLIYHLICRIFYDKTEYEFQDSTADVNNVFEQCLRRVQHVTDLGYLSAAFRIHNDCKILANKIQRKVRMRLADHFMSREDRVEVPEMDLLFLEKTFWQSFLLDLGPLEGIDLFRSKIPFAV